MKKILSVILIFMMVFVLTACDGDDSESTIATDNTATQDDTNEEVDEDKEPTDSEEDTTATDVDKEEEPIDTGVAEGELLSSTMFDITITPEWTEEADSRYEGEAYSNMTLKVVEGEDARITAEIHLDSYDVTSFRSSLRAYDVDLYDYAVNGTGDRVNIAGYDCLVLEREYWGEQTLTYIGRDEASGTTLEIDISGEYEDELVSQLISNLTPKITDQGLTDYPYFWEGERIVSEDTTSQVGNFTITGQNIPLEESMEVIDIFSTRIANSADAKIWLGYDEMLTEYSLSDTLSAPSQFELDEGFTEINADINGNLFVSDFGSDLVRINPDKSKVVYTTVDDYLAMHKSGEWGLTYFLGSEVEKVNINGDVATVEPYLAEGEFFEVDEIRFTENYTALFGSEIDGDTEKIMIIDSNKTPMFILGGDDFSEDDDYLGSVTDIVETANGFIAVDGNMREFLFWDKSGNFIGTLSDSDILGSSYPWISDMELQDDGSILVVYSEERSDASGYEVLVTRISGF